MSNNDKQTVPRTVWKGQLTLGLLAMPVRFVTAARTISVSFNRLHRSDLSPLRQMWACAADNEIVGKDDVVKGYEYEKGKYVIVEDRELEALAPQTIHAMEVSQFVYGDDVDPVFFDSSYYLEPGEGGERSYALLYAVMRKAKCWAITRLAMHNREHVAILRPGPRGLILQTLFYDDEIRSVAEFRTDTFGVGAAEIELAERLVESMLGPFNATQYRDTYREKVMDYIAAKVQTPHLAVEPVAPPAQHVPDILEALRLSVQKVASGNLEGGGPSALAPPIARRGDPKNPKN